MRVGVTLHTALPLGEGVGGESGGVVGGQGDQVVEDACLAGGLPLELLDVHVRQASKLRFIVVRTHQAVSLVPSHVPARRRHGVERWKPRF